MAVTDAILQKMADVSRQALEQLYQYQTDKVELQPTRKEFTGDYTLVVFPYLKASRKSPEATAEEIGQLLLNEIEELSDYNVVKGFLNLSISDKFWIEVLDRCGSYKHQGGGGSAPVTLVEYSSPNTNKPLHLGHIRNCLLGYSVAEMLAATGHEVIKAQIVNDRGIHICKSMVAWLRFGEGETPQNSGIKGDHLVGKYYVEFDKAYRAQVEELMTRGMSEESAKKEAPIMHEARAMLQKWEQGDQEIYALWERMNAWVYDGFAVTYKNLGVDFDKHYYESDTYLLGKKVVEEGLQKGIFYRRDDGSVWVDLTDEGLDEKLLLRSDGTSVYITQDIGTAIQRYEDFGIDGMIYTVGNEQDYHFKVLFIILRKLGYEWAEHLYHLSYGMVDLPSGKMKSREGTVVDADDLIRQMEETARGISDELGKTEGMSESDKQSLYHMIGLGALKYYILRVDPRKRMLFNPQESIDFQGNTGPFIQYTHARIRSLIRKAGERDLTGDYTQLQDAERNIIKHLANYAASLKEAASTYSPAVLANYIYDLVKSYNALYQQLPILTDENEGAVALRLKISKKVAEVVKQGMALLGIQVPERM